MILQPCYVAIVKGESAGPKPSPALTRIDIPAQTDASLREHLRSRTVARISIPGNPNPESLATWSRAKET